MALFTETEIRQRAEATVGRMGLKTAARVLREASESFLSRRTYDIFLSHSFLDAKLILGMKGTLEDLGYSVCIDWIVDPKLDRSTVTPATADILREFMTSSQSLFYVSTANAAASLWMPWECGFFDGMKEKVAIVPIQISSHDNSYSGQEYLGLYPYVVKQANNNGQETLWVRKSISMYVDYDSWVKIPNSSITWREG